MKKILTSFALIFLFFSGTALAYENLDQPIDQPVETQIDYSQANVAKIDRIIETDENLKDFITSRAINGIDVGNSANDSRICPFCWLFAAVFAGYLFEYAKKLKSFKKKVPRDWYMQPLFIAIGIYLGHAVVHVFLASSIFLNYFWMILFDELVVAYLFYFYNFVQKKSRKLSRKTA
jgi:hypothetical protein